MSEQRNNIKTFKKLIISCLLLLVSILLFNCKTVETNVESSRTLFSRDSIHIITPEVSITKTKKNTVTTYNNKTLIYPSNLKQDNETNEIRNFIIKVLKKEFPKGKYFDLPIMLQNDNMGFVETALNEKWLYPNKTLKAPTKLVISDKKYTLLISMSGDHGYINNVNYYFILINNKDKIIELVDRYHYEFGLINHKKIIRRINKGIAKIVTMAKHN